MNHDPDLAACLNSEALINALEGIRNILKLFKALDVVLKALAPCSGTCRGDCIGCLNEHGLNCTRLNIAVVSEDAVYDLVILTVFLCKVGTDLSMGTLNLVIDGLADVVQETCALCKLYVDAEFHRHKACKM